MPISASCTPQTLKESYHCIQCASESEVLMVILWALAKLEGTYTLPEDLPTLLEDTACWNCVSDSDLLRSIAILLAQKASRSDLDITDFWDEVKCLPCADPKALRAAIVPLLCQYLASLVQN